MKKLLFSVSVLLLMPACENGSIEKVKIFGTKEFISSEWKSSDIKNRSKMIYSFLKKNNIKNMNSDAIYKLLGRSTAYYEYNEFPAYSIDLKGDKYIIAFLVDRENSRINKYIFRPEIE